MALYLDLPVYKVCNELYVTFVKMRRTLPREERYTIGQELDRAMVEVLVLIQRINSTRDKVPLIARARQLVVEIQVRTRVLRDVKALSIGHFTELFDLSENKTRLCDARHGVEFLGAFVKPFRTYVASRSLRRIRGHLHTVTPRMNRGRAQAVVNSSLGVLSHYDCRRVCEVMIVKSGLMRFGAFSEDGLRYCPNALDWALFRLKGGK